MASQRSRELIAVGLIVLAGAVAFLPFLGQASEILSNEMRHSEIAREMAVSGDFVVPRLLGEIYFDKPPVMHALIALGFRIAGGASMFLARLPSALAGILGALVLYAMARKSLSPRLALWTAVLVCGVPGYAFSVRAVRPDAVFTLFVLLACWAALETIEATGTGRTRRLWGALAGVAVGLAGLCKGPFGLAVVLAYVALAPRRSPEDRAPARVFPWAVFVLAALGTLAAWLAVARAYGGAEYVAGVLGQDDLPWNADGEESSSFLFYVVPLLTYSLPLLLFSDVVLRHLRNRRLRGALGTVIVCVVVLSLFSKKRPHYLMPLFPLLTLATVEAVARHGTARVRERFLPAVAVGAVLLIPVRFGITARLGGEQEKAKWALARAVGASIEEGDAIVCHTKLATSVAFILEHDDVSKVDGPEPMLAALERERPHTVYLMPQSMAQELGPRLRPGATLDELYVDDGYVRRGEEHWSLYRLGGSGPPSGGAGGSATGTAGSSDAEQGENRGSE